MELDALKETADMQGLTTRADGPRYVLIFHTLLTYLTHTQSIQFESYESCIILCRTPVPEIILDELSYNRDMLSPFLQVSIFLIRT